MLQRMRNDDGVFSCSMVDTIYIVIKHAASAQKQTWPDLKNTFSSKISNSKMKVRQWSV